MVARMGGAEARAAAAEAAEDESARQAALWKRRCAELGRERAEEREAARRCEEVAAAKNAMAATPKHSHAARAEQGQEMAAGHLLHSQVVEDCNAMAQCTLGALTEAIQWQQERMKRIDATLAAAAAKATTAEPSASPE